MKLKFLFILLVIGSQCLSQDYSITIENQEFPVELGKSFTYITESGDSIVFEINGPSNHTNSVPEQATNSFENSGSDVIYEDNMIRFQYPDNYSIATTRPLDNMQQITMVSGTGSGIILQQFSTMNPEGLGQFFLSQLIGDGLASDAKKVNQTIDGKKVKGLRSSDSDGNPVVVYTHGKGKQGIVIALIGNQSDDNLLMSFLQSLAFKF